MGVYGFGLFICGVKLHMNWLSRLLGRLSGQNLFLNTLHRLISLFHLTFKSDRVIFAVLDVSDMSELFTA